MHSVPDHSPETRRGGGGRGVYIPAKTAIHDTKSQHISTCTMEVFEVSPYPCFCTVKRHRFLKGKHYKSLLREAKCDLYWPLQALMCITEGEQSSLYLNQECGKIFRSERVTVRDLALMIWFTTQWSVRTFNESSVSCITCQFSAEVESGSENWKKYIWIKSPWWFFYTLNLRFIV